MGRKYIVPYGLYRAHGFISAKLAERTGFSTPISIFCCDRARAACSSMTDSAARGEMASRKLIAFKHAARSATRRPTICSSASASAAISTASSAAPMIGRSATLPPARKFSDYIVEIDRANLPGGVEIIERL